MNSPLHRAAGTAAVLAIAALSLSLPHPARITRHIALPVIIEQEPVYHPVELETIGSDSEILINGIPVADFAAEAELQLPEGIHSITLVKEGFPDQTSLIEIAGPTRRLLRHQPAESDWKSMGTIKVGRQPKGLSFTPDGSFLIVTLLDDSGFDLVDLRPRTWGEVTRIDGQKSGHKGYVESLVCPEKQSFWISQMTTDRIYEYNLPEIDIETQKMILPALLRELPAGGVWTKVMTAAPDYSWIAVANWVSNSVAVLDYATGRMRVNVTGLAVPRGLAVAPDGSSLYVCSFEGGSFIRLDPETGKETGRINVAQAAMRHIALEADGKTAWVSDMARKRVYRIDTTTMTITRTIQVGSNPNTIVLSPDNSLLIVSCRGPNSPAGYLKRSLIPGEVHIIETSTGNTRAVLTGGNQPTGLALSPDGRILAFSNFLDHEVEVYAFQPLPALRRSGTSQPCGL